MSVSASAVGPVVLLVEDNPADARLVAEALAERCPAAELRVAANADEALGHLAEVASGRARRPSLVLLDLNLPGRPGTEVLQVIRGHHDLAALPVVVLTSTVAPAEVGELDVLGADDVVRKPLGVDAFYNLIEGLCGKWLVGDAQPEAPRA